MFTNLCLTWYTWVKQHYSDDVTYEKKHKKISRSCRIAHLRCHRTRKRTENFLIPEPKPEGWSSVILSSGVRALSDLGHFQWLFCSSELPVCALGASEMPKVPSLLWRKEKKMFILRMTSEVEATSSSLRISSCQWNIWQNQTEKNL